MAPGTRSQAKVTMVAGAVPPSGAVRTGAGRPAAATPAGRASAETVAGPARVRPAPPVAEALPVPAERAWAGVAAEEGAVVRPARTRLSNHLTLIRLSEASLGSV